MGGGYSGGGGGQECYKVTNVFCFDLAAALITACSVARLGTSLGTVLKATVEVVVEMEEVDTEVEVEDTVEEDMEEVQPVEEAEAEVCSSSSLERLPRSLLALSFFDTDP